ncbi:unnamed protein product, partial [marine sediment metagenome]
MPEKIKIRVAEAQRRDVGRFIVRVDADDMRKLNIQVGDIIEIEGTKKTAAIAWPAYSQDQGRGIVRMDGSIRRNAKITLGDSVIIRKANENPAKEIILAPTSSRVGHSQPGLET